MNYMTGTYALSLFPCSTFIHRATLVCQDTRSSGQNHKAWMDQSRAEGYIVVDADHEPPEDPELEVWRRRVGDRLSWVLRYERLGERGGG